MAIFWPGIGAGFGEPGGTPPPRIPRSPSRDDFMARHCLDNGFQAPANQNLARSGRYLS